LTSSVEKGKIGIPFEKVTEEKTMQVALWRHGYPRGAAKWLIAALVVAILASGFLVYEIVKKEVVINVDGQTIPAQSFQQTVGELLQEKAITVNPKDKVEPNLTTRLADDQTITITRAFWVEVQADGKEVRLQVLPSTVQAILSEAKITLAEKDLVKPELTAQITAAAPLITVSRIREEMVTRREVIGFRTEQKQDNNLEKGIRRVVTRGKEGVKEETLRLTYQDGKLVSKEIVGTKVIKEPVNQVVANGALQYASRGGRSFQFEKAVVVSATAYTYTGSRTATGTRTKVGTVAVDPRVIPLGSRLYVEGYGYARAEDTGGAIRGSRIDVFLETESEARRWGRRTVKVYVLK